MKRLGPHTVSVLLELSGNHPNVWVTPMMIGRRDNGGSSRTYGSLAVLVRKGLAERRRRNAPNYKRGFYWQYRLTNVGRAYIKKRTSMRENSKYDDRQIEGWVRLTNRVWSARRRHST